MLLSHFQNSPSKKDRQLDFTDFTTAARMSSRQLQISRHTRDPAHTAITKAATDALNIIAKSGSSGPPNVFGENAMTSPKPSNSTKKAAESANKKRGIPSRIG